MGPFETIDLNAPGGVADYAERLGPLYHSIAMDRRHPAQWQPDLIERVAAERRHALPLEDLASRCDWRDKMLMMLAAHRTMNQSGDSEDAYTFIAAISGRSSAAPCPAVSTTERKSIG